MDFLLSHWHCIVPAAGILIAILIMREKPKGDKKPANKEIDWE